jgi:hypothetical protein
LGGGLISNTACISSSQQASEVDTADNCTRTGDSDGDGYADMAEAGIPLCGDGRNEDSVDDNTNDDGCGSIQKEGLFSEAQFNIGTLAGDPCGYPIDESFATKPSLAWPSDLRTTSPSFNKIDTLDLGSFVAPIRRLDTKPGDTRFHRRWDLKPGRGPSGDAWILIEDMAKLVTGSSGFPPMLGGLKAFGGPPCPWPP